MKNRGRIEWIAMGVLFFLIVGLTFLKTPETIKEMLESVSQNTKSYSVFVHVLFLAVIGLRIFVRRIRNTVFSLFIAFLSLSTTIVALK
jgi:uncharacterized membrane protein YhaH (DUF805 family)